MLNMVKKKEMLHAIHKQINVCQENYIKTKINFYFLNQMNSRKSKLYISLLSTHYLHTYMN